MRISAFLLPHLLLPSCFRRVVGRVGFAKSFSPVCIPRCASGAEASPSIEFGIGRRDLVRRLLRLRRAREIEVDEFDESGMQGSGVCSDIASGSPPSVKD